MGNDEGSKQKNISDTIAHDGDVLPPSRVRCDILHGTKCSKFILNYHLIFLPIISSIFWSIFLLIRHQYQ